MLELARKNFTPWPHLVVDNFLDIEDPESFYEQLMELGTQTPDEEDGLLGNGSKRLYNQTEHPVVDYLKDQFNNPVLARQLKQQFGLSQDLVADTEFDGLTYSDIGSYIGYHSDFNYNNQRKKYRLVNAILYLNLGYMTKFGGHLHLINPQNQTIWL